MLVFMTGASGYVGSGALDELRAAGHDILALARSDRSEATLSAKGARTVRASLGDETALAQCAARADAIVHTGFDHDFTRFRENCELDQRAVAAMGRAIAGSDRRIIITSAIGILPRGMVVDETTGPANGPGASPRALTEAAADALREDGVHVHVVRLPPSVHGPGDPNFVATLVRNAREKRASAFVGSGDNCWPAVHRDDAARLFAACVDVRSLPPILHAVAETGIRFEDIARAIGEGLGLPVISISPEDAPRHFGGFAHFATMDARATAELTTKVLAFRPSGLTLLQEIQAGLYFR